MTDQRRTEAEQAGDLMQAQALQAHPARDYREHTVVGLPDGGQNQLWSEVQALTAERDKLAAHLTQIHTLIGRTGGHDERHLEMASCTLSGALGLTMDLHEVQEEVQHLTAELYLLTAELAELRSQLATATADRDVFRQELALLNRRFVEAMT